MKTPQQAQADFVRDLIVAKAKKGQKFTDGEVVSYAPLMRIAYDHAADYAGSFSFLIEMRDAALRNKMLSVGQARGVLNCMIADARRAIAYGAPATTFDFAAIAGLFAKVATTLKQPKIHLVAGDGTFVVIRVASARSKCPGAIDVTDDGDYGARRYFGRIKHDGTYRGQAPDAVLDLLRQFSDDPAGIASFYGRKTGRCSFCNLPLTDERSTAVGYGPICADRYDLPWGSVAA